MKTPASSSMSRHARGFSLVELMVGVAIGLFGLLVIFKTVSTWDTHTRSTTAGGQAQSTGALAMFNIQRDMKQAGMGIGRAQSTLLGCSVLANDTGRLFNFLLAPVVITPGASGGPDKIDVLYGNSSFFVDVAAFSGSTATSKTIAGSDAKRRSGFKTGDLVVATDGTNCQLVQITDDTNPDGLTLAHTAGSYTNFYAAAASDARYNGGTGVTFTAGGGSLFSLGPTPQQNTWQVSGDRLTRTDNMHGTVEAPLAEGVVSLKAQYGIDTDGNNQITPDEWVTALPVPVDWTKVRAIRLAVLVRSKQFEKSVDPEATGVPIGITTVAPTWSGAAGATGNPFVMTNVGGATDSFGPNDADPANWRFYRYRVYEAEIPLRNMIWGTAPP
jgi:type IV pilus assembly protein PilW